MEREFRPCLAVPASDGVKRLLGHREHLITGLDAGSGACR